MNRVSEILQKKGFRKIEPTDEILLKIGVSRHRFSKILNKKTKMNQDEIIGIASWLGVEPTELFVSFNQNDFIKSLGLVHCVGDS